MDSHVLVYLVDDSRRPQSAPAALMSHEHAHLTPEEQHERDVPAAQYSLVSTDFGDVWVAVAYTQTPPVEAKKCVCDNRKIIDIDSKDCVC